MGFKDKFIGIFAEDTLDMGYIDDKTYQISPEPEGSDDEEVVVQNDKRETLVQDIYTGNNMADLDKSILKAKEVINSLPKEISVETKRTTATSILSSFGFEVTGLVQDGEARMDKLKTAKEKINTENMSQIQEKKQLIKAKSEEIEQLEREIYDLEEDSKIVDAIIGNETKTILELVEFMVGGEQK